MKEKLRNLKREVLLEKAGAILERGGYEALKIADVAQAGSVSMSTIYALFGSKEGLYIAYIRSEIEAFVVMLQQRGREVDEPLARLSLYLTMKFAFMKQRRSVVEPGMRNNPLYFQLISNEFADVLRPVFTYIADCFRQLEPGCGEGEAMLAAYTFNGFSDGYVQSWLETGEEPAGAVEEICRRFVCMLRQCGDQQLTGEDAQ